MAKGSLEIKDETEKQKSEINVNSDENFTAKGSWRNLLAFWVLGLCNNYGYVVMLSAAHDILDKKFINQDDPMSNSSNAAPNATAGTRSCNTLGTGTILLADILPCLIVKFVAPFLPFLVHIRLATCILFTCGGFLLVSFATMKAATILGVIMISLSSGLGEVTLLGYSNQYPKQVISTWSSGTGGAGVIGALSYASLATWIGASKTLLVMLTIPLLQAITFWIILVHPLKITVTKNGIDSQETIIQSSNNPSFKDKVYLIPGLMKYMIPLGLVYLFEYFINQGLLELIEFDGIWLTHSEQYRWLQVDYQIGVFLSRSSVNVITINNIWLMAVLQFFNLIILLFETIYYYIPNIWIVFGFVLWEGLLGGGSYVNTFYKMSTEVPREERKFSLAIVSIADSIGIALAGWFSMHVHDLICQLPKPHRTGY